MFVDFESQIWLLMASQVA